MRRGNGVQALILWVAGLVASNGALAAKFANQFVEFEMPPKWQCTLEGAEWVCQNTEADKKREAIIILAAKLKGDQDSLDNYLAYLKKPKDWTSIDNKAVKSEVKYARPMEVNGQSWIDSLHLESEIPGFYTRYLATVKQDIGVLVTYSVNKAKHGQYINDFDNLVKTLKVFRKSGGLNAAPANSNLFQNAQIPAGLTENSVFPGVTPKGASDAQKKPQEDDTMTYLLIAGIAVVGFMIWKKRRGGG